MTPLSFHSMARLVLAACVGTATCAQASESASVIQDLARTGADLDRQLFESYNQCDLEKFGAYFASDVEFYHDQGGLMRSRENVVEATKKYICGKVHRELVEGTLQTFPMKGYGAVQLGSHRFCEIGAAKCGGIARFVHLWQNEGGTWRITRVISYDHQAIP